MTRRGFLAGSAFLAAQQERVEAQAAHKRNLLASIWGPEKAASAASATLHPFPTSQERDGWEQLPADVVDRQVNPPASKLLFEPVAPRVILGVQYNFRPQLTQALRENRFDVRAGTDDRGAELVGQINGGHGPHGTGDR